MNSIIAVTNFDTCCPSYSNQSKYMAMNAKMNQLDISPMVDRNQSVKKKKYQNRPPRFQR